MQPDATEQEKKTEERVRGRNLRKKEVPEFIKAFLTTVNGITVNGKPFANSVSPKMIGTNPDLTIEEIRQTLDIKDESKVDFLRQLYVRGGSSIVSKLFPDEVIVNLPTISFEENGNAINLSY